MSDTSEPLKQPRKTQSTETKPADLKDSDLALVAERLALIQGHLAQMPKLLVSGARMKGDILLIALWVGENHRLEIVSGAWLLDGKDVTKWAE